MSIFRETEFTWQAMAEDFQIFCQAPALECGDIIALPAPRLQCGVVLAVRFSVSRVYTFTAASGVCLTVTACFGTAGRAGFTALAAVKPPRRGDSACLYKSPLRKMTVLRL